MEIPDRIFKDLQRYLIRSVLWDQGKCGNPVAEQAECGNELAQRAMDARTFVLNMTRKEQDD